MIQSSLLRGHSLSLFLACGVGVLLEPLCLQAAAPRTPAELHRRLETAQPGDVIPLAPGEWQDVDLLIEGRGTAARPITIAAEEPGRTIITGASRLRLAGEYVVVSGLLFNKAFHPSAVVEFRRDSQRQAAHCRLTECAFIDCDPPSGDRKDGKYVSIYGHDNRVDHCYLAGKRVRGATLVVWLTDESSGRHQVDFNHFGPRPVLGENGGETIRVGDSVTSLLSARCTVDFNLFEECNGEAEIISSKSCDNLFRHNTFRRCSGALTLRHGHRCLVEGNWFLGEEARGAGGVRIIGEDHRVVNNYFADLPGDNARAAICVMSGIKDSPLSGHSPVINAMIAWNTIINCKEPLVIGYADAQATSEVPPRDCLIVNNLISSRRAPLVRLIAMPVDFRWSKNLLFGAETGLPAALAPLVADPQLTLGADGIHRPAADSPARGAADDRLVAVADDIEGQPRVAPYDIGCDQSSTAAVQFRPLTARETGPPWLKERTSSKAAATDAPRQ